MPRPLASLLRTTALVPLAALTGCGGGEPTTPAASPGPPASIRFVSGGGQSDTAMAILKDPVVVEVGDSAGHLVRVAPVTFTALGSDAAFCAATSVESCARYTYQDSAFAGRASVRVRLSSVAGTVRIQVGVPGTMLADTATLTVLPAAAARLTTAPADSSAYAGSSYRVTGRVLDQYGNVRADDPVTFTGSSAVATISADGVFSALAVGRALALARSGWLIDTAWITVPPRGTIAAMEPSALGDRKSTRLNSSHMVQSRMPSSA